MTSMKYVQKNILGGNIYVRSKFSCVRSSHDLCVCTNCLEQRCTTFLGQGLQCIIFSALEGRRQNYEPNFRESSINYQVCFYVTIVYIACGLMISVATRAVLYCSRRSCKIVSSSMKFKFMTGRQFLVFFNLLRGPDKTRSGAGSGPRVAHPWLRGNIGYQWTFILVLLRKVFTFIHFLASSSFTF